VTGALAVFFTAVFFVAFTGAFFPADFFTAAFFATAGAAFIAAAFFAAHRFFKAATMFARPAAESFRFDFEGSGVGGDDDDPVVPLIAAHRFCCARAIRDGHAGLCFLVLAIRFSAHRPSLMATCFNTSLICDTRGASTFQPERFTHRNSLPSAIAAAWGPLPTRPFRRVY
jgi:hypothetical protein